MRLCTGDAGTRRDERPAAHPAAPLPPPVSGWDSSTHAVYSQHVYTVCRVPGVSISHALLGLLEGGPRHGYDLKHAYDERFATARPLHYGQVYATLSRLLRNGLVVVTGVEAGGGPDRKRYAITDAGVTDVERWLRTPEKPEPYLQSTLFTKVVLALLSDRNAEDVLDAQRAAHLAAMRELNRRKAGGDLADALICDHALFHLEADLRWLELTAARLTDLATRVRP
jgi:DNA-binding PadR family transcriptional regulator